MLTRGDGLITVAGGKLTTSRVAEHMGTLLGWKAARREHEIVLYRADVERS